MKRLSDVGEFGLIDRISKRIPRVSKDVVVGIGDDCCVLRKNKDKDLLLTSDMLIEGRHFDRKKANFFQIGWKALGCSLSDIAAMAGVPRFAIVSLGSPAKLPISDLDRLYNGIFSIAREFKVDIVGGDTNSSDRLIIDVTLLGEVECGKAVLRNGATPGEMIFVTGELGGSIRGKHLKFTPRINEARYLAKNFPLTSMIDISDGLSSDLRQIAKRCDVGAVIFEERIPVSKAASGVAGALNDGEDFELLFTVPRRAAKKLIGKVLPRSSVKVSLIGEVVKKSSGVVIVNSQGRGRRLHPKGYRHF